MPSLRLLRAIVTLCVFISFLVFSLELSVERSMFVCAGDFRLNENNLRRQRDALPLSNRKVRASAVEGTGKVSLATRIAIAMALSF